MKKQVVVRGCIPYLVGRLPSVICLRASSSHGLLYSRITSATRIGLGKPGNSLLRLRLTIIRILSIVWAQVRYLLSLDEELSSDEASKNFHCWPSVRIISANSICLFLTTAWRRVPYPSALTPSPENGSLYGPLIASCKAFRILLSFQEGIRVALRA